MNRRERDASRFLRAIHPHTRAAVLRGFRIIAPGAWIGIWTKGKGESPFLDHHDAARWAIEQADAGRTPYVQTALISGISGRGRACIEHAVRVTAPWADVDGPHRTEGGVFKDGPKTTRQAIAALDRLPIPPSVLVTSGTPGSVHAYWHLKTRLDDMKRAAALVEGWQRVIRTAWRRRGWVLDHAHDLARVLRIPGTLNHKHTPPREVRLVRLRPERHAAREFERIIAKLAPPPPLRSATKPSAPLAPTSPAIGDAPLIRLIRASQQAEKFDRLSRGDMTGYDSPSNADHALACILAFWTQDAAQIERIMRTSRLAREKWDERRPGGTYLTYTIRRALERTTEHFGGERRAHVIAQPWKGGLSWGAHARRDRLAAWR